MNEESRNNRGKERENHRKVHFRPSDIEAKDSEEVLGEVTHHCSEAERAKRKDTRQDQ